MRAEAGADRTAGASASRTDTVGYAFGLGAGLCYGATAVLIKNVLSDYEIPPLVATFISLSFGGIFLSILVAPSLPQAARSPNRAMAMFLLSGVVSGIGVMCYFLALERADVVVVAPLGAINPLFTLLFVRIFLERLERITLKLVLGAFLVVGGTTLVVVGNSL